MGYSFNPENKKPDIKPFNRELLDNERQRIRGSLAGFGHPRFGPITIHLCTLFCFHVIYGFLSNCDGIGEEFTR